MSYKWFKHWQAEHPSSVILIETRAGYLSYEESAFAVCRLTSQPLFVPERKERVRGLAISVPRKEFPALLDRLMRCRVSYLVAREDYLVYQKAYNERYYQIYAAPIGSVEEAEECRLDRPVGIDDRVTVKNLETRKECVWTLVPGEEAEEGKREKSGPLSADSVVGKQLVGCFSGEDVSVTDEDGEVTKYRIQLAIDRDGHKLKKHRRPTAIAEEEAEEETATAEEATTEEAPQATDKPVEEAVEDVPDEGAEDVGEEDIEAVAEEVAEEAGEAEVAEESAEAESAEVAEAESAEAVGEETWEETDSGTPFFRRIKVMLPADNDPREAMPPALPDDEPKPRLFRKWFGKKEK